MKNFFTLKRLRIVAFFAFTIGASAYLANIIWSLASGTPVTMSWWDVAIIGILFFDVLKNDISNFLKGAIIIDVNREDNSNNESRSGVAFSGETSDPSRIHKIVKTVYTDINDQTIEITTQGYTDKFHAGIINEKVEYRDGTRIEFPCDPIKPN